MVVQNMGKKNKQINIKKESIMGDMKLKNIKKESGIIKLKNKQNSPNIKKTKQMMKETHFKGTQKSQGQFNSTKDWKRKYQPVFPKLKQDGSEVLIKFPIGTHNYKKVLSQIVNLASVIHHPASLRVGFKSAEECKTNLETLKNLKLDDKSQLNVVPVPNVTNDPLRKCAFINHDLTLDQMENLKNLTGASIVNLLKKKSRLVVFKFDNENIATAAQNKSIKFNNTKLVLMNFKQTVRGKKDKKETTKVEKKTVDNMKQKKNIKSQIKHMEVDEEEDDDSDEEDDDDEEEEEDDNEEEDDDDNEEEDDDDNEEEDDDDEEEDEEDDDDEEEDDDDEEEEDNNDDLDGLEIDDDDSDE